MRFVPVKSFLMLIVLALAQPVWSASTTWERSAGAKTPVSGSFRSTQAAVLPTAETVGNGLLLFEISHRFLPKLSDGHEVLWGLDGPAHIRFSLGYGLTGRLMLSAGRSNRNDNYDLTMKYGAFRTNLLSLPWSVAFQAGASWNTEVFDRQAGHNRNFQYFAMAAINTDFNQKLALGTVPAILYNFAILSDEPEQMVTLGLYARYQVTRVLGLLVEWNAAEAGYNFAYDALTASMEIETGGHFFKVYAANSTSIATAAYLPGTNEPVDPENWHLGFTITRILKP